MLNEPIWQLLALSVTFALASTGASDEWKPLFFIAEGICFVLSMIYLLLPLYKEKGTKLQILPDMPIADVTNYIVNDSSVQLKKPQPAEIIQFGSAKTPSSKIRNSCDK